MVDRRGENTKSRTASLRPALPGVTSACDVGDGQGAHCEHALGGESEHLATGDDQVQRGTAVEQGLDEAAHRGHDPVDVVEHQERGPVADEGDHVVHGGGRARAQQQLVRDHVGHEGGVGSPGEVDHPAVTFALLREASGQA